MRKFFFLIVAIAAVALYQKANAVKETANEVVNLESIESLAQNESGGGGLSCRWEGDTCSDGTYREECLTTGDGANCTCGSVTRNCK